MRSVTAAEEALLRELAAAGLDVLEECPKGFSYPGGEVRHTDTMPWNGEQMRCLACRGYGLVAPPYWEAFGRVWDALEAARHTITVFDHGTVVQVRLGATTKGTGDTPLAALLAAAVQAVRKEAHRG